MQGLEIGEDEMTRARYRRAVAGLLVGVFALLAGCRADALRRSDVFTAPDSAAPEPRLLADGTPVFVVARRGAQPAVVEAISTHVPWGMTTLVRWCPGSNTFVDIHGSRWDTFGTKRYGPAPAGLATFVVTAVPGSRDIRVGARLAGAPVGTRSVPESGKRCEWEDVKASVSGVRRVDKPADLRVNEWDLVDGVLVTSVDRPTRLCPKSTAASRAPCADGRDAPQVEAPPAGWGKGGDYLVRRVGGVVDRIVAVS